MGRNKILIHLSIACYVLCIFSQKHSDSCQYAALDTVPKLSSFFFFNPDVPTKLNRPCQKWMRRMACCREACRTD